MTFELFVALRYLLTRRKQAFISIISLISVAGVALGVATLIVVFGIMNGLNADLKMRILGVSPHIMVLSMRQTINDYEDVVKRLKAMDGVTAAVPFIYSEVMISGLDGVKGAVLRGVRPESLAQVLSLDKGAEGAGAEETRDAFAKLKGNGLPGIMVGWELAKTLGAKPGQRLYLLGQWSGGTGVDTGSFRPSVRIFELEGTFRTGLYDYDSSVAYIDLEQAARLLGYPPDRVTGIEVRVSDVYNADRMARRINDMLGPSFYTRDWMDMNMNLFGTLKLEKAGMLLVLLLIVLLAAFSIITTLVLLVMEKSRDIAVLMALGVRRNSIGRIFMYQGALIGFIGTTVGLAAGVTLALLLKRYQFVHLPEGVYTSDTIPVLLGWVDMTVVAVAPLVFCFMATLYPARKAAGMDPSEMLRGR